MVVERAIDVGFHLNFGTLMRSRYSKTPTRLAITDGFPFNPTYDFTRERRSLLQSFGCFTAQVLDEIHFHT